MSFLSKYTNVRKMLAAVVGTTLLVLAPHFDFITVDAIAGVASETVVSVILALLTVLGVYNVPNTESDES